MDTRDERAGSVPLLRNKRITLEDGRYLIYYSFEGPMFSESPNDEMRSDTDLLTEEAQEEDV